METMETDIIIRHQVVGVFQVNVYLVVCPETKKAVIIDPGGEGERVVRMVEEEGAEPIYILNTHGHADHVLENKALKERFSIPVCMHEADDEFFSRKKVRTQSQKELGLPPPGPADRRLKDGDVLEVGKLRIEVLHTPGHSPGSVCFHVRGNLFSGDTLFVGDVGRTDLVGGSFETLLKSLEEKVIVLPGETIVRPGHDYGETPTSTLAWEMRENPYITDFILAK